MGRPDFDELLYIVSGVIFLATLGVALAFVGQYVIGDLIVILSVIWALSIFYFMKYVEKKHNDEQDS